MAVNMLHIAPTTIRGRTGTLRDNADWFVQDVESEALRTEFSTVCRYADSWPAMVNEHWRNYVLMSLAASTNIVNASFSAPDSLDGWTFYATVMRTPMALRALDDPMLNGSIDPPARAKSVHWYERLASWFGGRRASK